MDKNRLLDSAAESVFHTSIQDCDVIKICFVACQCPAFGNRRCFYYRAWVRMFFQSIRKISGRFPYVDLVAVLAWYSVYHTWKIFGIRLIFWSKQLLTESSVRFENGFNSKSSNDLLCDKPEMVGPQTACDLWQNYCLVQWVCP